MTVHLEAEIQVGEAAKAAIAVAARWSSGRWNFPAGIVLGILGMAIGGLLGEALGGLFRVAASDSQLIRFLFGGAFIWFVGLPMWRRFVQKRYKRRLAQHGTSGRLHATYDITPSAVVYSIGGVVKSARWEVVSELFRVKGWWVMMAQGEAYYLPRRAFDTPAQEREFISSTFDLMGSAARERSSDAASLLASAV